MEVKKAAQPMQLGLCRLCGQRRKCRDVNYVYIYMEKNEVYADMLYDCFGLHLSDLQGYEGLVCAPCVVRLRSSCDFKRQVLRCEAQLQTKIQYGESSKSESCIKNEPIYLEMESMDDDSMFPDDDDDDDDDDNKTLAKFKLEPTESSKVSIHPLPILEDKASCLMNLLKRPAAKSTKSKAIPAKTTQAKPKINKVTEARQGTEKEWDMKKMLILKMEKLKAEQKANPPKKAVAPSPSLTQVIGRASRKSKDLMAQQNTIQIVESSYVCPFKNITGTYYCYYCRTVFIDPADLRLHSSSHDPAPFARLWRKNKAVKLDITRIDCRLCDAKIDDIPTLKQHLTSAHGKRMHQIDNEFLQFKLTHPEIECLECGQSFIFIDRLIKHMTVHFGKCVCDKCGATFIQPSSLEAHLRCHEKQNQRFPCHICGKNLSTNRSRHVHVAVVHEKKPVIDCFHCEQRFFSYDQRNKHMVTEHNHNSTIPCTLCDRVFDSRKKYLFHNQTVHIKEYLHTCEICSKKFITRKHFNQHRKTHENKG